MLAGVPEAYFQMGQRYLVGSGVPADSVRAYALWQRASQLGDPQAQVELAKNAVIALPEALRTDWYTRSP